MLCQLHSQNTQLFMCLRGCSASSFAGWEHFEALNPTLSLNPKPSLKNFTAPPHMLAPGVWLEGPKPPQLATPSGRHQIAGCLPRSSGNRVTRVRLGFRVYGFVWDTQPDGTSVGLEKLWGAPLYTPLQLRCPHHP